MFFCHRRPPRRPHFFRSLGWLLVIGAGVGAVYCYMKKQQRAKEELDWFLLNDEDFIEPELSLEKDIKNWSRFSDDDQTISLSFTFGDVAQAKEFMDDLAKSGFSSLLDQKNGVVDVVISGSMNEQELEELVSGLNRAMMANEASYRGFYIE